MTVHVLLYNHRHGTDVFAFESNELAIKGAASIIETYLSEMDDEPLRKKLGLLLDDKKWDEAVTAWSEYMNEQSFMGEDFEFHELEVQGVQ